MSIYDFIRANEDHFATRTMCRVLEVSTSSYYTYRSTELSERSRGDSELIEQIKTEHHVSGGTYGAPRIHRALRNGGHRVSRKRVARLMRQHGLRGAIKGGFRRPRTTRSARSVEPYPDRVNRNFRAVETDRLWLADITYVPTDEGFLYLAVILDVCSRRIVGWSMHERLHARLVCDAVRMAVERRNASAVVHHSDHGSQYTSEEFAAVCRVSGIEISMGSVGDCYDNAMCESFFATLESEVIDRRRFRTRTQARHAIFIYIEGWYNLRRLHSSIGYMSPVEFEERNDRSESVHRQL